MTPTREQILAMAERLKPFADGAMEIDPHLGSGYVINEEHGGPELTQCIDLLRVLAQAEPNAAVQEPTSVPAYSAPFTTDVPQCCGEPTTCNDPCESAAAPAEPVALAEPGEEEEMDVCAALSVLQKRIQPDDWSGMLALAVLDSALDEKLADALSVTPSAAPPDLAAERDAALAAPLLPCSHPTTCMQYAAETGEALYCGWCNAVSFQRDLTTDAERERDAALSECDFISESAASAARASAETLRRAGEEIERLNTALSDWTMLAEYKTPGITRADASRQIVQDSARWREFISHIADDAGINYQTAEELTERIDAAINAEQTSSKEQ